MHRHSISDVGEIGLKTYTLAAHGQTWQGHTFCLRKGQLIESLEILASSH